MDRVTEINFKHDQLRALLTRRGADTLWIQKTHNISWITAGANPAIPLDNPTAPYSVIVTADKRTILADNIELPRIQAEDRFEDFGFDYAPMRWYDKQIPPMPNMITDLDGTVDGDLQKLRWKLTEGEQVRLRALGADAAAAIEGAVQTTRPGDSEWQIAARLDAACRESGGNAIVNLVATDERIERYRHPYVTNKRLERYVLIAVVMRRGGLMVSATRLAYHGQIPSKLLEKARKVATIDAAVMVASQPGRTLGTVFADLQRAYAEVGEAEQWQNHHQGGLTAYRPREVIVTPGNPTVLEAGNVCAWNPSIVGCKSEDTILIGENGFEIVSAVSPAFPHIDVRVGAQVVRRPGILEL